MDAAVEIFDRAEEDVGNIVELGHVNLRVPDQRLATAFYVSGLGLTRDPFLVTGVANMWINVGTGQFHLPTGAAQTLDGTIGLVLPDRAALLHRLAAAGRDLDGTRFAFAEAEDAVAVTCPWGNRFLCHAPGPRYGRMALGLAYVELLAPPGSAAGIASFYRDVLRAAVSADGAVRAGVAATLRFREENAPRPAFSGAHVQITLADFSGPHRALRDRGLITEESNRHQYRFQTVADPKSGARLIALEHEVRSMGHPMYARPLLNRDPMQTNDHDYAAGHDALGWSRRAAG